MENKSLIIIQLLGRLGNCMFLFGLGLSLQKIYPNKKVVFYYSKAYPEDTKKVCDELINFFKNDFQLDFIEDPLPAVVKTIEKDDFENAKDIPIDEKENTFLRSFFQSYKFLDKEVCQEKLRCPVFIQEKIKAFYGDLSNFVGIHVRRGDYLNSGYFITMRKEWYEKCINLFDENQKFIVTSDDLAWCKENIIGENIQYADKHDKYDNLIDLYIHSFCRDNIISASSFSWWGSYLNPNKNKKIYAPEHWVAGPPQERYYTEEIIKIRD